MANVDTDSDIDWMACELIEKIPGKVSGRPLVRGTRILPDAIVDSYDLGETIDEPSPIWAGPDSRTASCYGQREDNGIDVLLTGDQTLTYEQNLTERRLAIVALSAIQLPIIKKNLPRIIAAIDTAAPGSFQTVDCGTFSRKKPPGP
jgi:hypothetical protein